MLVGDHGEIAAHRVEEFAGGQQEIRVRGLAEGFIAAREGFVDEPPALGDRRHQARQQRPVQIVRHHDRTEAPVCQRPGRVAGAGREARDVDIDRGHRPTARPRKPCVASTACRQVEDASADRWRRKKARDPGRGLVEMGVRHCAVVGRFGGWRVQVLL